jgi:hypothetical protein
MTIVTVPVLELNTVANLCCVHLSQAVLVTDVCRGLEQMSLEHLRPKSKSTTSCMRGNTTRCGVIRSVAPGHWR